MPRIRPARTDEVRNEALNDIDRVVRFAFKSSENLLNCWGA